MMDRSISVVVGVVPPSVSANDCRLVTLRGPDDGSLDLCGCWRISSLCERE
jgi:hypothetical protein